MDYLVRVFHILQQQFARLHYLFTGRVELYDIVLNFDIIY